MEEEEIMCEPCGVSDEAMKVRKLTDPKRPSQQEVDEHFLTSFSPKARRAAAGPRMCLERAPSVCVAPQVHLAGA